VDPPDRLASQFRDIVYNLPIQIVEKEKNLFEIRPLLQNQVHLLYYMMIYTIMNLIRISD
jgi:hypothetical protein